MSLRALLKKYQLHRASILSDNLDRVLSASQHIQNAQATMKDMKNHIEHNQFESVLDAIDFFKRIKQVPQEDLIYEVKVNAFLINKPFSNKSAQLKYCAKEMKMLNQFTQNHSEFMQYCVMQRTDLDIYYFKRPTEAITFECTEPFFRDPIFYTARDLTLSRLNAYKKYAFFLKDEHSQILDSSKYSKSNQTSKGILEWTSNRIDLTELIYALYHSRSINNGKIDIAQITTAFEGLFKIELGDVYKTYSDIKHRKRSVTKFLDTLSNTMKSEITHSDF